MRDLRKLIRRIRFRPLGNLKRRLQRIVYRIIELVGGSIFSLLIGLKIIKPPKKFVKEHISSILIIRPDRIGDLVLATPTFKVLRENFPNACIAVLIDYKNQDLIVNNPYINAIFAIKHKGIIGLFFNIKLIKQLTPKRFDLALILYSSFWCGLLAVLSNIPHRLGYAYHGNGFLLNLKPAQKYEEINKHEVEINLDLLKLLGIESPSVKLYVSIKKESEKIIEEFLAKNNINFQDKIVVIHPGAYEEYRRWLKRGFAKVADYIISNGKAKVFILGGPGEEKLVKEVVSFMEQKPIVALGLSLSESTSLIKRAKLFLGHATGPMHIACALEVPVIAILGSKHIMDCYVNWGPYGIKSMILHKDLGCIDCQPADCRRYRCMEAISAEDVIGAVEKLL